MKTNPFGFSQSFTCRDAVHNIYLLYVPMNTESPGKKQNKNKANNSEKKWILQGVKKRWMFHEVG